MRAFYKYFESEKCYSPDFSFNLFGRNISTAPIVNQNGTANPKRKANIQPAIKPIKRNKARPNATMILYYFCH